MENIKLINDYHVNISLDIYEKLPDGTVMHNIDVVNDCEGDHENSHNIEVRLLKEKFAVYYDVVCCVCGRCTDYFNDIDDAIDRWNSDNLVESIDAPSENESPNGYAQK